MAIKIDYAKHAIAESTLLAATRGGANIYSVKLTTDLDNGSVVNITDMEYQGPEYFNQVKPASTKKVGLVLQDPLIYQESPTAATDPANFYNEKGDIVRVYELVEGDIFTVSAAAITAVGDAPVKGNYIVADNYGLKEVAKASAPADTVAFVATIIGTVKRTNGTFYKIRVAKNA